MNIHEYQAKKILHHYGVLVPDGQMADSITDAIAIAEKLKSKSCVVKSQIHAGGRGSGYFKNGDPDKGGIRVCHSNNEVESATKAMLGQILITKQTNTTGKRVNYVYVEAYHEIHRELYLSVLIDRVTAMITFVLSTEGGQEIENIAKKTPEKIFKVSVDPVSGISGHHCRNIAFVLGVSNIHIKSCSKLITDIYRAFTELDASLIEINPLVYNSEGTFMALDVKMSFDYNALYRHPDILSMRDDTEEDPQELEAARYGLNYITLHGTIGCMVNGAGLAMATMDIIKLEGAEPANFLDVGGNASVEQISAALRIIVNDYNVQSVLVNIFGGIMRCDVIAEGIVAAVTSMDIKLPLVVRLEGTNVDKGKYILANSNLAIIVANDLSDAAKKAIAAAKDKNNVNIN